MAGLDMRFALEDALLAAELTELLERGQNLTEAFDDIGQDMVTVSTRAFEKGQSPEGVPWMPSAAAKREGRKTLIDRGLRGGLMGSFSYAAGPGGVVYGTNIFYAAFHQTGYSFRHAGREVAAAMGFGAGVAEVAITVPARPFVGHSDQDLRRWEATLRDYLAPDGAAA